MPALPFSASCFYFGTLNVFIFCNCFKHINTIPSNIPSLFCFISWEYQFIKSQFAGQLPQQYQKEKDATKVLPQNMNDMNKEEHIRYVSKPPLTFIRM